MYSQFKEIKKPVEITRKKKNPNHVTLQSGRWKRDFAYINNVFG